MDGAILPRATAAREKGRGRQESEIYENSQIQPKMPKINTMMLETEQRIFQQRKKCRGGVKIP